MKNVYAKANAKGSTVFYRDGKRISRANLTAAYVDEARANLAELGFDATAGNDNEGSFIVEICLYVTLPCYGGLLDHADIDAVFTVNVDTVATGVEIMKSAKRSLDGFIRAKVYDACDYAEAYYDRWHMERCALCLRNDGKVWFINGGGRVYAEYVKEISNSNTTVYLAQSHVKRAEESLINSRTAISYARKRAEESSERLDDAREELNRAMTNYIEAVIA